MNSFSLLSNLKRYVEESEQFFVFGEFPGDFLDLSWIEK